MQYCSVFPATEKFRQIVQQILTLKMWLEANVSCSKQLINLFHCSKFNAAADAHKTEKICSNAKLAAVKQL